MKEIDRQGQELIDINENEKGANLSNEYKGYLIKIEKDDFLMLTNCEITKEMLNSNQEIKVNLEKSSHPTLNISLNKKMNYRNIKNVSFIYLPKNKYDEKYFLKEGDENLEYYEEEIGLFKKTLNTSVKNFLIIMAIVLGLTLILLYFLFFRSKKEYDSEEKLINFGQNITWPKKRKNGRGIINYQNGLRFVGNFKKGRANGEGTVYDGNGEVLVEGNFTDGALKNGSLYHRYFFYKGGFKNGSYNKYGEIQYNNYQKSILKEPDFYLKDGFRYEGYWKDGKKNGQGKMIYEYDKNKVPKIYYIGDWEKDKKKGRGILYYGKSDYYDGSWENDQKHGIGQIYKNGKLIFEGAWVKDIKNGRGMSYNEKGMKIYEGEWLNNKKNGKGKLFYDDGDYYDGDFVNDKRHGIGMVLSKGKIACSGNFVEDNFESGKVEFENKHCQKIKL